MTYFAITLIVLLIFIAIMALGVIFSNKPLKGSCGGLSNVMGKDCEFCEDRHKCKRLKTT